MAKKIITEEGTTATENAAVPEVMQENPGNESVEGQAVTAVIPETISVATVEIIPPSTICPPVPPAPDINDMDTIQPAEAETVSLPPSVEALFKIYPGYESLYVDSHGGVYTVNTAPAIRGSAILYKNPYHK